MSNEFTCDMNSGQEIIALLKDCRKDRQTGLSFVKRQIERERKLNLPHFL